MKRKYTGMLMVCIAFLILIIDSKTTIFAASDAVSLCITSVIPSLFPFIIFSMLLNTQLLGMKFTWFSHFARSLGLPAGAESVFILGILGGYPIGAQSIEQAHAAGSLADRDAKRLMAFCNNAGPAFILGMGSSLFDNAITPWLLWIIHIASALVVAGIVKKPASEYAKLPVQPAQSVTKTIRKSMETMATICTWVILFRILIAFLERWILWIVPENTQVLIIGILELVNGFTLLPTVAKTGAKFVIAASILGAGGICVGMQTVSVTKKTGLGLYIPGKVIQAILSFYAAYIIQYFVFSDGDIWHLNMITLVIPLLILLVSVYYIRKKCSILHANVV